MATVYIIIIVCCYSGEEKCNIYKPNIYVALPAIIIYCDHKRTTYKIL